VVKTIAVHNAAAHSNEYRRSRRSIAHHTWAKEIGTARLEAGAMPNSRNLRPENVHSLHHPMGSVTNLLSVFHQRLKKRTFVGRRFSRVPLGAYL